MTIGEMTHQSNDQRDQAAMRHLEQGLRRALVIGLGGSGVIAVTHLKAECVRAYGADELPARIRFLAFDTAEDLMTVPVGEHLVSLEPGSEFFNVGHTPVGSILRNLERQTAIHERLGEGIRTLPAVTLRNGSKQNRLLGLLALLWRWAEVEQRLHDAIWALAGREEMLHQENLGQPRGINVFIVNSLGGGTGSAMFLDIAYLVRELFDELGDLGEFCYLTGVGLLPQAFVGIRGPNIVPNTVAALKELNHCMLRGGFRCRYPNGRVIHNQQAPFNLYYLVDGVDERGQVWRGQNEVCAMIGQGLFLQIGSQMGQKGENDFDNVDEVLAGQTPTGEGTFCASFGLASMRFDAQGVVTQCARRQASRLVGEGLLGTPEAKAVAQQAGEFMQAQQLDSDSLRTRLGQDDQGMPLVVNLDTPAWLMRLDHAAQPAEALRYAREYDQVRLGTDYRRWVDGHVTTLCEAMVADLQRLVRMACRERGIAHGVALVRDLRGRLSALGEAVEGYRTTQAAEEEQAAGELPYMEESLLQAAEANWLMRKPRVARALNRYLGIAQTAYAARLERMMAEGALALVRHLERGLGRWEEDLDRLTGRLRSIAQQLRADTQLGMIGPRSTAALSSVDLADPAYVLKLFHRYAPSARQTMAELVSTPGFDLATWAELPPAELQKQLLAISRPPFAPITKLRVEEVLAERREEMSPQARLEQLLTLAVPSWSLDRARLNEGGNDLVRLIVLGVTDENRSIYADRSAMLVSTHDPYRLVTFVATIGAPHVALQQYPAWENGYRAVRGRRPLHVLSRFQADGRQGKLAFALGSLFGFITHRGRYFYYRPADELAEEVSLAHGLSNAVQALAAQETLTQEIMELVDGAIAHVGIARTLELLAEYYTAPQDGHGDLSRELKRLVRGYAEELRPIQQLSGVTGVNG